MPGRQGAQNLSPYITQELSIQVPYEEQGNPVTVLWGAKKVGNWLFDASSLLSKSSREVGLRNLTMLQAQNDS